jgi:hypothetical protein
MGYALHRTEEEHSADCDAYPFEAIPRRIFLDTNIIDCLVKWSECVFEHQTTPKEVDPTLREDIESLMHIFTVGSRASWDMVASEKTVAELKKTPDRDLRNDLLDYGIDLARQGKDHEAESYARDLARRLVGSRLLAGLPHVADQELIAHAVAFRCDSFCTSDRCSLHRKRARLRQLPVRIMTPVEWWQHVRPWAGLWC